MKNFLNSVRVAKPRTNVFDLSHDVKLSCNMGWLVPICVIDAVPGDRFKIGCQSLIRLAPMVAPMMHRVDVYMHYFFVPKRLLWDNWGNYITKTEVDGSVPAPPFINMGDVSYPSSRLPDFMGLPDPGLTPYDISAMPFAAYQLIYDEYYRDQNLIEPVFQKLSDGDNNADYPALIAMRRRAWEHDYFTAALPTPQKGDAVEIPISGTVSLNFDTSAPMLLKTTGGTEVQDATSIKSTNMPAGAIQADTPTTDPLAVIDPNGRLSVDNADTSINDLRKAYALQRFLEKLMRGGSRLTEFIRNVFGVTSSDARLQRPEYITGMKSPVTISEVLNTTGTTEAPQGTMAGHGASVTNAKYGSFFCEEHGYIIGIMSTTPKTAYQQGIPKHWLKINDSTEHFLPDFANIGEQEILNKEVYADHSDPDGVFGYIPRYGEYKFEQNRVAGDFKTSLNYWTMARIFENDTALNQEFVECNPTTRVFAVDDPNVDHLWCHVYNDITAVRLMPKYGTPTF